MVFDKSRVYTALNADELEVGSTVILADDVLNLRKYVEQEIRLTTLTCIHGEDSMSRFEGGKYIGLYTLAYLVEEPAPLEWTDLKVGDVIRAGSFDKMITVIDSDPETIYHIKTDGWLPDSALKEYQKVNKEEAEND